MASSPSVALPGVRPVMGMEVPVPGSDCLKWNELTISPPPPRDSDSNSSASQVPQNTTETTVPFGVGYCHVIPSDPPAYLFWRIQENMRNVLEVFELFPSKAFPEKGLRLVFPEALHPFSFICKSKEGRAGGKEYMIYTLSVSGIAYLLTIKNPLVYTSGSIFPDDDLITIDVQTPSRITALEATSGCLMVGRSDGSVSCYQLGALDKGAPGFMFELRDDAGIGRLWNIMSRGKVVGAVQHLVLHEMFGRKVLFAAHVDGNLSAWDLQGHTKILNYPISLQGATAGLVRKFWVGNANYETCQCFLAVLYEDRSVVNFEAIAIYALNFNHGERSVLSLECLLPSISLDEGKLVDLKLTDDKLWVLKEEGPMIYNLSCLDIKMKKEFRYNLHEEFIAEQLFRCSDHPFDDLVWNNISLFLSAKDQIPYAISSIFLHRLLQPGISLYSALYATLSNQKKCIPDSEVLSLSFSGLKRELVSIVESEGVSTDPRSTLHYWKKFSSHFFHHWCQNNIPYGLFIDPNSRGGVGLIRKSSISLFRQFLDIELVMCGSFDDQCHLRSLLSFRGSDFDCEILFDVLRLVNIIRDQLGRVSSSVLCEAVVNPSIVSCDDTIFHLLKLLEGGHSSSLDASISSEFCDDTTWQKKRSNHKNYRKFSITMLLSLNGLLTKAATWGKVLDIIEIYLEKFLPDKVVESKQSKRFISINSSLLVQVTCQVAALIIHCAFDMLVMLRYIANISSQVHMVHTDLSRIRLSLIPMVEDILVHWYILHFVGTTQTEPVVLEDFSLRLSSLHIDKKNEDSSWDQKLGTYGFTLAFLLEFPTPYHEDDFITSASFSDPNKAHAVWNFFSWALRDRSVDESNVSMHPAIELACLFLQKGQYQAAENLLVIINTHMTKKESQATVISGLCACLHLLGYCLVLRAQDMLNLVLKQSKIREAICCFFRAASGEGASLSIERLPFQTSFQYKRSNGSTVVWKFFYFQWVMQLFEQHNLSDAACKFALSALALVDEVIEDNYSSSALAESPEGIKGRLWANIFKFSIDLGHYGDAYCAIISNPDEDNKYICLRRFLIVLYEQGESKILCNGELPFVGLVEKVEQELHWKAERSDVSSQKNLYKLLYAFQMYRNNWRKAAWLMYRYSDRLKEDIKSKETHRTSSTFQEILFALSASINALQLVIPSNAWLDASNEMYSTPSKISPNKRPRHALQQTVSPMVDPESQKAHFQVDIEMLEKDYVLTMARYLLSSERLDVKCTITGDQAYVVNVVDALVEASFYEVAFTLILKFWKGSQLKRELERVFVAISKKCCSNVANPSLSGTDVSRALVSMSSDDGMFVNGKVDFGLAICQPLGNTQWEMLELYLGKYKTLHPRLPVTVAETLLYSDPQIELPLWLVHMFKMKLPRVLEQYGLFQQEIGSKLDQFQCRASSCGMTGQESDSASLFRLYVDYGRYAEATNLFLEYIEASSSLRPADVIKRKKMFSVWFPHVTVERLWCHLQDAQSSGHMVDQFDRLKNLLSGSIRNHLNKVKVDSEDAMAAGTV